MSNHQCDVAVIGAGPAGISAAMWLQKFKVDYLLIDREAQIGGELMRINQPIRDYPGLELANGRAFRNRLELAFADKPLKTLLSTMVTEINPSTKTIITGDGVIQASVLVLALGLNRRKLGLPNEREFVGKSLSYSTTTDRDWLAGNPVAVVGGGDGACENALMLAEICPKVTIIARGNVLRARAEFVEQITQNPRIEVVYGSSILSLEGEARQLRAVVLQSDKGKTRLELSRLVVKIGFEPNTASVLPGFLTTDENGYYLVDRFLHTSQDGVFAIGDLSNPHSPCISAAMGDGAVAAREAYVIVKKLHR
jgi:thioredoxin reductase (NADPH)